MPPSKERSAWLITLAAAAILMVTNGRKTIARALHCATAKLNRARHYHHQPLRLPSRN